MKTQNVKLIFTILKELILLVKLILDEWDNEKDNEKE